METRRKILSRIAMWFGLLSSYGTALAFTVRYLYPEKRKPRTRLVYVTEMADLPDGQARVVEDLRGSRVQVVRQRDRVVALSMVCPHLGCQVRWDGERQRFQCPCHNAAFDADGRVLFGPPPRGLDRYDVELTGGSVYLKLLDPSGT